MGSSNFEPAQEFFDQWIETYKGTFGRFWETPAVGPSREKSEKAMEGFSIFADFCQASIRSNIELQAVSTEAMRRTQEKVSAGDAGDIGPDSYKDVYKIWMDTYSETFQEFLKSGDFAQDMGEVMSRALAVQQYDRDMMEENYLKPLNLPTKSEIDELNKEVYALKRTVKGLTKQVKKLSEK